MFSNKQKKILDFLKKNLDYEIYEVSSEDVNRIDKIIENIYDERTYLIYFKLFCYLNDIDYPLNELYEGRVLRIYNMEEVKKFMDVENVDLLSHLYK